MSTVSHLPPLEVQNLQIQLSQGCKMSGRNKFIPTTNAISHVDKFVNLIGVAVATSDPSKTAGTDFFCSIKIVDESEPRGFYLHFFANPAENLPSVKNGDIVLVSNFKIKRRGQGCAYGISVKRRSTFALFEGISDELVPYQVSPRYEYKPGIEDEKYITGLRQWHHGDELKVLHELVWMREIKAGKRCNLLCKILHIAQVKKDEWMIFIWDGTDIPPASVDVKLEETKSPLPLALESSPLSREILCTFPPVGTVLRMSVDQGHEKLRYIELLKTNRWVKLSNIRCEATNVALWRAVFTLSSKLTYIPDDDDAVMQRQRFYGERLESKSWGRMPFTSFPMLRRITETDCGDVPFATLMEVITHPKEEDRFKCVVRVVVISPWKAEELWLGSKYEGMWLTLEDPTARLRAVVSLEEFAKFFGNCESVEGLRKKRNMLVGLGADSSDSDDNSRVSRRNPPWIQCCLRRYSNNKNDVWGTTKYFIFATACVAVAG